MRLPWCSSLAGSPLAWPDAFHCPSLQLSWSALSIQPHSLCLRQVVPGCLRLMCRCQSPRMRCCSPCSQIHCCCCCPQLRSLLRVSCYLPKRTPVFSVLSWLCPVSGKATVPSQQRSTQIMFRTSWCWTLEAFINRSDISRAKLLMGLASHHQTSIVIFLDILYMYIYVRYSRCCFRNRTTGPCFRAM